VWLTTLNCGRKGHNQTEGSHITGTPIAVMHRMADTRFSDRCTAFRASVCYRGLVLKHGRCWTVVGGSNGKRKFLLPAGRTGMPRKLVFNSS
jgi:hypothetical protein